MHDHGWIDTLEGGHIVCPGDYIITGVKGERYPCKPDIFQATNDLVANAELDAKDARIAELEEQLREADGEALGHLAKAGIPTPEEGFRDAGLNWIGHHIDDLAKERDEALAQVETLEKALDSSEARRKASVARAADAFNTLLREWNGLAELVKKAESELADRKRYDEDILACAGNVDDYFHKIGGGIASRAKRILSAPYWKGVEK